MRHVAVPDLFSYLMNAHGGVLQQLLGLFDAHTAQQVKEALIGMLIDKLGQVPLADVHALGHVAEADMLGAMVAHIVQRGTDDEASGLAVFGGFLGGGLLCGRHGVQQSGHSLHGLGQFVHFTGLAQVAAHAEADSLLGIGKVAVSGKHGDLHMRIFALEGFSPSYGFTGIAVAILGRSNPFGVVLTSLMFAILDSGALRMARVTSVSSSVVVVIQSLIIMAVAAPEMIRFHRRKKGGEQA